MPMIHNMLKLAFLFLLGSTVLHGTVVLHIRALVDEKRALKELEYFIDQTVVG